MQLSGYQSVETGVKFAALFPIYLAPQTREDGSMLPSAFTSRITSLRLRRVRYPTDAVVPCEGVVTQHDANNEMVTVLNTDDGSFWRGPVRLVEVIA